MIPEWLDTEVWEAFLEMRKEIKKPMTEYAKKLAIKKLEQMMNQGQDPNAVLEQSIFCNWQGLFPVKQEEVKRDFVSDIQDRSWAEPQLRRVK